MASRQNIWPFGDSTKTTTVYHRRGASFVRGANYKGYRVWEDENGWHTSLDPGSWFDTKKDVTRFIDSWEKSRSNPRIMMGWVDSLNREAFPGFHPNPPRGWFDRCVKAVKAKGGAYDPNAVCAAQERRLGKRNALPLATLASEAPGASGFLGSSEKWLKKHGVMPKGKGNPMSKKNRKRGNPEAESATAFEAFHGYAPDEQIVVDKHVHYHSQLWAVGSLEKLSVLSPDGVTVDLDGFDGAMLSANENNTQLYVEGGDQTVDLAEFAIGEPYHDKEDLGQVLKVWYFTTKTHLGDQGGEAVYHHKLGEEGTKRSYEFGKSSGRKVPRPRLVYDVLNQSLEFVGGEYLIEPEGIRN